jgi:16S rRNA C967 or C1407 C5-methylase (RsmB/RsmF family)
MIPSLKPKKETKKEKKEEKGDGKNSDVMGEAAEELQRLQRQKEDLEEQIKIAKVKYFKRALDEDTYKQIMKDNQGRLIKIESDINRLEKRVIKIEEELGEKKK